MAVEHELALRRAWYVARYGSIPEHDQVPLLYVAQGLGTAQADRELSQLAEEILDYFGRHQPEWLGVGTR